MNAAAYIFRLGGAAFAGGVAAGVIFPFLRGLAYLIEAGRWFGGASSAFFAIPPLIFFAVICLLATDGVARFGGAARTERLGAVVGAALGLILILPWRAFELQIATAYADDPSFPQTPSLILFLIIGAATGAICGAVGVFISNWIGARA
ncbi:MAG: hypothetical protein AAF401_19065 [Pseudomonadota bacterium]